MVTMVVGRAFLSLLVIISIVVSLLTRHFLFKVNNNNTRKGSEISAKLKINHHRVIDVVFVSLLLTLNVILCPGVSMHDFEQVSTD